MAQPPAEPVLKLDVESYAENTVVVRCHGRLVSGSAQILSSCVTHLLPETKRIILDLSDLQHTDSIGLGTLVRLYVSAKSAGSSLELTHLSKQIQNLLGMTNLLEVFTVIGERGIKL
ncbi:MAG: hypothetical protein NVSMB62_16460 [Acidobacteriaceae bacterium]